MAVAQFRPAVVHRVPADRNTCPGIIGNQTLFNIHLLQGALIGIFAQRFTVMAQQRPFELPSTFHLPERITAMLDAIKLVERADLCEPRQLSPIQGWDALSEVFRGTERTVLDT